MSQYPDPFLSAYMSGSQQGLGLADDVARMRFQQEQAAARDRQFQQELEYKTARDLVDDTRAGEYLKIQQQYGLLAQQDREAKRQAEARMLAQDEAARRFNLGQFRQLRGQTMMGPPQSPDVMTGMTGDESAFMGMDPRLQSRALDPLREQAEREMMLQDNRAKAESLERDIAAIDAQARAAGGWLRKEDPLIQQLSVQRAALTAQKLNLTGGVPMASTLSLIGKTQSFRPDASATRSPMDATSIRREVAKLQGERQMIQSAMGRPAADGMIEIYNMRSGEPIVVPKAIAEERLARIDTELANLIGDSSGLTGPPETAVPLGAGAPPEDDDDELELEMMRQRLRAP